MMDEISQHLELAERLADAARAILLPMFKTFPASWPKDDMTPVSEADLCCEQKLREILAIEVPGHAVRGEEFGQRTVRAAASAADAADAARAHGAWQWVIDPIDGTKSFLTGSPLFCTLIALLHKEKPVLGVIEAPATAERWSGSAGGTCTRYRCSAGVADCAASQCTALAEASAAITLPATGDRAARLLRGCAQVRYGGDAYNFGCVAAGHLDLAIEEGLKPHDYMALVPVVEGAGGVVTDFDGAAPAGDSDIVAAANRALHDAALEMLSA